MGRTLFVGVEIMIFEWLLFWIKSVIGVDPCTVWSVKVAGGIADGNARVWRRIIADTDQQAISRTQVSAGLDFQVAFLLRRGSATGLLSSRFCLR